MFQGRAGETLTTGFGGVFFCLSYGKGCALHEWGLVQGRVFLEEECAAF